MVQESVSEAVYEERELVWEAMTDQQRQSLEGCCWDDGFVAGFLAAQKYFTK